MPYAAPTHAQLRRQQREKARQHHSTQSHDPFTAGRRWRRLRLMFLRRHPVCATDGCNAPALDVHHVIPRRERPDLAYSESNLQALCHECHSRHTATDERGKRGGGANS